MSSAALRSKMVILLLFIHCLLLLRVAVIVLWLFFAVLWVGLQYANVACLGHTYLLFIEIPTALDVYVVHI